MQQRDEDNTYRDKKAIRRSGAGTRKGFSVYGDILCVGCFDKKLELERLRNELIRLKAKVKRLENRLTSPPNAGAHTPPSRQLDKKNSDASNQSKRGGAKHGHVGRSRKKLTPNDVQTEDIIELDRVDTCPQCDVALHLRDTRERTVVDMPDVKAKRILYRYKRMCCPLCKQTFAHHPPIMPKALYGNRLLAQSAVMHYVHGISLGTICKLLGPEVREGSLIASFQRLGKLCAPAKDWLRNEYQQSFVKHADETTWRTDGSKGYAWLFTSATTSIFEFRQTRAARVAHQMFGNTPLDGVLVVDRYNAYNRLPCQIQYCYAHLLREVTKLENEFPENDEVCCFVNDLSPLMAQAMRLRKMAISDAEFYNEAAVVKNQMLSVLCRSAKHVGIKHIYGIFSKHHERMFHWANDRRVPADNNLAEREIRSAVISRKISFGSQSEMGAQTRSHIMTVLFTAQKRLGGTTPEKWLYQTLNAIARDSNRTMESFLRACTQSPSTTGT